MSVGLAQVPRIAPNNPLQAATEDPESDLQICRDDKAGEGTDLNHQSPCFKADDKMVQSIRLCHRMLKPKTLDMRQFNNAVLKLQTVSGERVAPSICHLFDPSLSEYTTSIEETPSSARKCDIHPALPIRVVDRIRAELYCCEYGQQSVHEDSVEPQRGFLTVLNSSKRDTGISVCLDDMSIHSDTI